MNGTSWRAPSLKHLHFDTPSSYRRNMPLRQFTLCPQFTIAERLGDEKFRKV